MIAQTFTVLGQTIRVDDSTIFKIDSNPKTTGVVGLSSLALNAQVKVNGVSGAGGTFLATYVKTKSDLSLDGNEVKGIITSIAPIQIGTLTIILNGQTSPVPVIGACVEAEGTLLPGNILTVKPGPSGFKLDDDCNGDSLSGSITKAEVEGVISGFINDATPFKVGGQTVSLSPSATFRPAGTSAADLVDGLKIEVEGSVTNGVLLASKVKIKKNGVRIEALADSAVTENSFTILGITVLTNGIFVPSISIGTGLRVEGFKSGAREITATKIELGSADENDVTLRGPLDANAVESGFNILGVPVTLSGTTEFDDTTRANFLANATANTIVKAKGSESTVNAIAAREVELED